MVSAHSYRKPRQQGWVSRRAQMQMEDSHADGGTVDTETPQTALEFLKVRAAPEGKVGH